MPVKDLILGFSIFARFICGVESALKKQNMDKKQEQNVINTKFTVNLQKWK